MSKSYRLSREYLIVGVIGIVAFSAAALFTTIAAWWNLDGSFLYPRMTAVIGGLFWTAWLIMSVWMIAAWNREELLLEPDSVTHRGVFSEKRLTISDVTSLKWTNRPGEVVICTNVAKLKICFRDYCFAANKELVAFFREMIPTDDQEGWPEFEAGYLHRISAPPPRSRGAAMFCMCLFVIMAATGVSCWWAGLGHQWLAAAIFSFCGALFYAWRLWTASNAANSNMRPL